MAQTEVERFLGRIITDVKFRDKAASSLESACYTNGFVLSPAEISSLLTLDYPLIAKIAESIDDSIRRS